MSRILARAGNDSGGTRPGVWRLRVVVGYRPDGQPRQASRTVHGMRRVAQSQLAKLVAEVENGNPPMVGAMTLASYLERWMDHVRAHRQPDTTRNYAVRCRRFSTEIGGVRLDKLRVQQLDEVYRRWVAAGMAPSTPAGLPRRAWCGAVPGGQVGPCSSVGLPLWRPSRRSTVGA